MTGTKPTQYKNPLITRERLDDLYGTYNRKAFVHPDPLEFLYPFPDPDERALVGLIASCLAYGRVQQILRSVSSVLDRMARAPSEFIHNTSKEHLFLAFGDFRHRFTTGEEIALLLWGAGRLIKRFGSLYQCFLAGLNEDDDTILPALTAFVNEFRGVMPCQRNSLLPSPEKGSACKRLNLYLRWMVRRDDVDPGGWSRVPESKLIVPLDTHLHRISRLLNLTDRKQADMRTAMEITREFKKISPEDPVRYDFTLTRFGIRNEQGIMLRLWGGQAFKKTSG